MHLQATSTCTQCWSSSKPRLLRATSWAAITPMSSPRLAQLPPQGSEDPRGVLPRGKCLGSIALYIFLATVLLSSAMPFVPLNCQGPILMLIHLIEHMYQTGRVVYPGIFRDRGAGTWMWSLSATSHQQLHPATSFLLCYSVVLGTGSQDSPTRPPSMG